MASVSTEGFPYTVSYVTEMLGVSEQELLAMSHTLSISPKQDPQTSNIAFSHTELEVLRRALEMKRQGENASSITQKLAPQKTPKELSSPASNLPQTSHATRPRSLAPAGGRENLSVIVEAVSTAKEGIMKDMSRLLDDKLAGLDEVVVELIRSKSESDALKQKLKEAIEEKDALRSELSRFKPVQFGFYRKS